MSDISGISFGQMFPSAGVPPSMSAGQIAAPYAGAGYYNQNTLNNLYASGGGFGHLTNYYSQLAANQLSGLTPNTFNMANAGTGMTMDQMRQPWLTPSGGANNIFAGGDYNPYSGGSLPPSGSYFSSPTGGNYFPGVGVLPGAASFDFSRVFDNPSVNQYASGMFGGSAGEWKPQIDFSRIFNPQTSGGGGGSGLFGSDINPFAGLSHQQQQPQLDWSGVSGGAKADPYPDMKMPGGLNSPMTVPEQPEPQPQQQPLDYSSLFGKAVGGTGMPQQGGWQDTPSTAMPSASKLLGYDPSQGPTASRFSNVVPDLGSEERTIAPMFEGGGGAGGGAETQLYGAEPHTGMFSGSYNPYAMTQDTGASPAGASPGGGLSATDLSDRARRQLDEYMRGPGTGPPTSDIPENATADELAKRAAAALPQPDAAEIVGEAGRGGMTGRPEATDPYERLAETIPLPRARPEGADVARPPASIPATTEAERQTYQAPPRPPEDIRLSGPTLKGVNPRLVAAVEGGATFLPPGYHIELVSGKEPREFGYHPGGSAIDVRIVGPDGAIPHKGEDTTGMYTLLARGVKTWVAQNDPATAGQLGYGGAFGTRGGKPGEVPDLMHYDLGGSRGQMRPDVQFGNLKPLSEAERNQMPAYIPLLGANQVPLDGRVPTGSGTRAPVAPMQFGGGFGGDEFSGQMPSPGAFAPREGLGLMTSHPDFESRIFEPSGRDQLARLRADSYELPEVAPTQLGLDLGLQSRDLQEPAPTPLALDLGWNDLGRTAAPMPQQPVEPANELPGEVGRGGYLNQPGAPKVVGDTNLTPGDLTQRVFGDPFNPENYNTLDQAFDLAAARSPFATQLQDSPQLRDTLKALAVSEIGRGRSDEQYAAFIESVLNQSAARHTSALPEKYQVNDLNSFLHSRYYQPVNQGTMGPSYQYLTDNPGINAQLERVLQQVYGGSNVSNLATQNSSYDPNHSEFGPGALLPQYGGDFGLFLPGSNEYLTNKINPFNDPRGTKYIGEGMQDAYRAFHRQMTPAGTEPWRGR